MICPTLADLTPKPVLHSNMLPKLLALIIINHCFLRSKCGCPWRGVTKGEIKGSYWAIFEKSGAFPCKQVFCEVRLEG